MADGAKPSLIPVKQRPGIVRELTRYAGEGGWYDADKVRFRYGQPEKIGGWQNVNGISNTDSIPGTARTLFSWVTQIGVEYVAIGTNSHLVVWDGGKYFDITPIDVSVSANNALNTTSGSTTIRVSITSHGRTTGDYFYVTSVATTVGGNIYPVSAPFGGFRVSVLDVNTFAIDVGVTAAATSATAGGVLTGYFLIPTGPASNSLYTGWGAGPWNGIQPWGSPFQNLTPLRFWSLDNWGEDLVACPRDGKIYYWDSSGGISNRAYLVSTSPSQNTQILVSPEDRHLIAFGCPDALTSVVNPLYIRWCNQENITDWNASATNTAGDKVLSGATKIVAARRTRGQILIWTDESLFSMLQVGPPFTFGFQLVGTNCGVLGPNAITEVGGKTFWMADERFMVYDGAAARPMKCDVLRYVFDNLDTSQLDKVACGSNSAFNEVIWFYPTTSGEVDSYVIYNYMEDVWSIGRLVRTAWLDQGVNAYPLAASLEASATKLYYHEFGDNADGAAITSYIESNLFDLDSGQELMYVDRIVPDFSDSAGGPMTGNLQMTLRTLKYPNTPSAQEVTKGPYTVSAATQKIDTRIRGRHAYYRIESTDLNSSWRLGAIRFRLTPDGER